MNQRTIYILNLNERNVGVAPRENPPAYREIHQSQTLRSAADAYESFVLLKVNQVAEKGGVDLVYMIHRKNGHISVYTTDTFTALSSTIETSNEFKNCFRGLWRQSVLENVYNLVPLVAGVVMMFSTAIMLLVTAARPSAHLGPFQLAGVFLPGLLMVLWGITLLFRGRTIKLRAKNSTMFLKDARKTASGNLLVKKVCEQLAEVSDTQTLLYICGDNYTFGFATPKLQWAYEKHIKKNQEKPPLTLRKFEHRPADYVALTFAFFLMLATFVITHFKQSEKVVLVEGIVHGICGGCFLCASCIWFWNRVLAVKYVDPEFGV